MNPYKTVSGEQLVTTPFFTASTVVGAGAREVMGHPAPDPVVLRGHGADVQSVSFAVVDGVPCVLSGYAPRSLEPIVHGSTHRPRPRSARRVFP